MDKKIAIDVMGGDNAPDEIIKGAIRAQQEHDNLELKLVGKSNIIRHKLNEYQYKESKIQIIQAEETIGMDEAPAKALRKKKNSSLNIGSKLVKKNEADAFISAGNTGAVMAAGLFNIGRIKGIKRPAIATMFPARNGQTMVLDAGANVDSKPINLLQSAVMAQIQARHVLGITNPEIGLLSIGEEKKKGNKLTAETYDLLSNDKRIKNFTGNVEGRDIFNNSCDIVICDGFVGNVVLKTTEGVASLMFDMLKKAMTKNIISKTGALLVKPYLKELMGKVDYRQYGGAPLLGVNGVVIISHGSSDATAIYNAVRVAMETVDKRVVELIKQEINKDGGVDND